MQGLEEADGGHSERVRVGPLGRDYCTGPEVGAISSPDIGSKDERVYFFCRP